MVFMFDQKNWCGWDFVVWQRGMPCGANMYVFDTFSIGRICMQNDDVAPIK